MKQLYFFFLSITIVFLTICVESTWGQSTTFLPYAPIANPLPDTLDQLQRDSLNLKISRVRVNQAGYRPQDKKYFYYVGNPPENNYLVIDNRNKVVVIARGNLTALQAKTAGQIYIRASNNAQIITGGDTRYILESPEVSGPVYEGLLPELPSGEYRIIVGSDTSSKFIVDSRVYSWVKDAALKFFGVNRCGNSESWFHPPCHLKDPVVGGWHDCGDHLKEGITQSFATAMLGLTAAALNERDTDRYGFNHNVTTTTDGIPDILREAKHGVDFVFSSYIKAGKQIPNMITSVGNFGLDHQWWGRPEFQDNMPTERGGPPREARVELGANILANFAAGAAFVSRLWKHFDPVYSAQVLEMAKNLYNYAKTNQKSTETPAYNGNSTVNDELAFAAVALLWATSERIYLDELCFDKTIGPHANPWFSKFSFEGGWFANKNVQFSHDLANTDWASVHVPVLWAFFRLILRDEKMCTSLGLTSSQRLSLLEKTIYQLIYNLAASSKGDKSIELPNHGIGWGAGHTLRYDGLWKTMHTQQEWIWNRYQMGNILELFCYSDMAFYIQGTELPNTPASTNWKAAEVREVMIRQMDYMLGVNPWDISMIYGVGSKNFNHPHHRAANPEGKNMPGAFYRYRPPTGALQGGYSPLTTSRYVEHYDDYYHAETGIDASAVMILPLTGLAQDEATDRPADAIVRIVYVGYDYAIIEIRQSRFGDAKILYGIAPSISTATAVSDSPGVFHRIRLSDLKPSTRYAFVVNISDYLGNDTTIRGPSNEPFTFTTLAQLPSKAIIENVKVCKVSSDSVEIFWYTPNGAYDSRVYLGTTFPATTAYDGDIAGHPVKFHYMKIGGLKERTTYYFGVESGGSRVDTDSEGKPLRFTTPVEHVKFDLRTIRYDWSGAPAIGINFVNQDYRSFDSLQLRIYLRGTPEQMADFGARIDVGIKYNSAGYQDTHFKGVIDAALQKQKPIRLDDTFNPSDNTYHWYFPIPLGDARMEPGARFRMDIIFVRRNIPWNDELLNVAPTHIPGNTDWSFAPHSRIAGDPIDYAGVPFAPKDDLDKNYWNHQINYYITVYRKNEFVWGFSPSYNEQKTKKTTYEITSQITSPLLNPPLSDVFLSQAVPTVKVSGWATITEAGVINDVWVNGVRQQLSRTVSYNRLLNRWEFMFDVPVKNGTNVVDITLFAGPQLDCTECFGCALYNHHFFIHFTEASRYPSTLTLLEPKGTLLSDTAKIDTTKFFIHLEDQNGNISNSTVDTISALVYNPFLADSLVVKLIETGLQTGIFRNLEPISIVGKTPEQRNPNEISMSSGDRVYVRYEDPTDPLDIAIDSLINISNVAVPLYGWYKDINGDGAVDMAIIAFDKPPGISIADSALFWFPDRTTLRTVRRSSIEASGKNLVIKISPSFAPATTALNGSSNNNLCRIFGSSGSKYVLMHDSVGPVLITASADKGKNGKLNVITLTVSEALDIATLPGKALVLKHANSLLLDTLTIDSAQTVVSTRPTVRVLVQEEIIASEGDSLRLLASAEGVTDYYGNYAHPNNPFVPLRINISVPPIIKAWYLDKNADGMVETAIVNFEKKIPAGSLSFSFDWGHSRADIKAGPKITYSSDSTSATVWLKDAFSSDILYVTSGQMYLSVRHNAPGSSSRYAWVADSAAPLIRSAVYCQSPLTDYTSIFADTLIVTFSELVSIDTTRNLFLLSDGKDNQYSFNLDFLWMTDSVLTFLVRGIKGAYYPKNGDSIWIDPLGAIVDVNGNVQNNKANRKAFLVVKTLPLHWNISVSANPYIPTSKPLVISLTPNLLPRISTQLAASIILYDNIGNRVLGPIEFTQEQGRAAEFRFVWDGRNRNGRLVGTGTYLGIVTINQEPVQTVKMKILIGVKR